jgi:exosortase D (VPLPA-CTERM-specific)
MIGVLVEAYGEGAAEGFAHFFEGWLIFIASLGLLFLEIRLLGSFGTGGTRRPWSSLFALGAGAALVRSESPVLKDRMAKARLAPAYILSMAVLLSATVASAHVVSPDEAPPPRQPLLDFPLHLGDWAGQSLVMEQAYIDVLRFDDYMLADYRLPSDAPVNFYVAYYRSQKKSQSAHSPRTCIPGGGWEITSLRDLEIKGAAAAKEPIVVNRAVIQKGDQKQLVLYWFQQRGRVLANEYLVKWYLFWDALTKHRTDGALVRLTTAVGPGENEAAAERRLLSLSETVQPILGRYVPD